MPRTLRDLRIEDDDYPARLRALATPPETVTVDGPLGAGKVVAVVGTRHPIPAAAAFAHACAATIATRGGVVVSGGAIGIDASAHEGALSVGGRTWVVAPTGHGELYPANHGPLFDRVLDGGGTVVWPFPRGTPAHRGRFLRRNAVLAALADVMVVIQARIPSGALNAAMWARRLGRPRWVVCPTPWEDGPDFAGCQLERRLGARALTSVDFFLDAIGMPDPPAASAPRRDLRPPETPAESTVLAALSTMPRHVDEVVVRCGLPCSEVMTALLTLALDDVLVEGPEGSYRLVRQP